MSAFSANGSPAARTCLGAVSAAARPPSAAIAVSSPSGLGTAPLDASAAAVSAAALPKLVSTHPVVALPAPDASVAASVPVSAPAPSAPSAAMSATPARRRPLPLQHLAGGVAGGVTSTLLLHPLDLIKIRFAVEDAGGKGRAPRYSGVANAVTTITSSEGIRGLYRGVTPNLLGAGSSWGLYFMFYSSLKSWMQSGDSSRDLGAARHMLVASEAGVLTLALTNPISVVRTRLCLQTSLDAALPESKRFSGMFDALRKTYRAEGARGLYRGFVPGVWGVSHGALQFMAYEELKSRYNRHQHRAVDHALSTAEYLQFAALSKLFAACVTYPYQVVRARLQDHRTSYTGSMDVIQRIVRREGPRGLYRGLTPYLLHVTPNTGEHGQHKH
ncbi:Mitochondrial folate transporter/carrier [Amphibalanus amphitrite]|uniref:Solute carrier family 25 member 32 n=1 Tax=Amphibalanus amphitrite TaxID=1232801 RepID=A0A6A4X6A9_AMPAM|nr:Mitochondrial folate transporter/carrier [Amphibalanus amphitrite]